MTKAELISKISSETGIDQVTAKTVIESAMENLKKSLADNEPVFLRGFGTFSTKVRKSKTARNIATNTTIIVPERRVPFFKPCNDFKNTVK